MVSPVLRNRVLKDVARLSRLHPVVFVHGGGPQIEKELKRNSIPNKFVKGRRATSPKAMVIVERMLSGEINKSLASQLVKAGVKAVGLSCRDAHLIQGRPIPELGRAARPEKIDTSLLLALLKGGFLPVVSSVASDQKGDPVNINADDAASALATALKAKHLIFLTNTFGVLDQHHKSIPVLKMDRIQNLISSGVIQGGMIPKVQSAMKALKEGVGEVDIINGTRGVLLKNGTRMMK